jgi:hypothetical protein
MNLKQTKRKMLEDFQDDLFESIVKELERFENKEKVQTTVLKIATLCIRPFQYILWFIMLLLVTMFILNIIIVVFVARRV